MRFGPGNAARTLSTISNGSKDRICLRRETVSLESKPLSAVSAQDLQELIANQVMEKRTLEYKRDIPGPTHTDRREFLRDVSSFANTSGGHIVFGMREDEGRPAELVGLNLTDPDAEIAR